MCFAAVKVVKDLHTLPLLLLFLRYITHAIHIKVREIVQRCSKVSPSQSWPWYQGMEVICIQIGMHWRQKQKTLHLSCAHSYVLSVRHLQLGEINNSLSIDSDIMQSSAITQLQQI